LSRSPCIILATGNAGGTRHHFGDLLRADLRAQQPVRGARAGASGRLGAGLRFLEALFQIGQLPVLQLGHLVEITLAGQLIDLFA
jgi:hypothetical protein